jgi:hypothetical protein
MEKNEKRTRPYAPTVGKNVKSPSNLTEANPYTAENAILNEDPREDTNLIAKILACARIRKNTHAPATL